MVDLYNQDDLTNVFRPPGRELVEYAFDHPQGNLHFLSILL